MASLTCYEYTEIVNGPTTENWEALNSGCEHPTVEESSYFVFI